MDMRENTPEARLHLGLVPSEVSQLQLVLRLGLNRLTGVTAPADETGSDQLDDELSEWPNPLAGSINSVHAHARVALTKFRDGLEDLEGFPADVSSGRYSHALAAAVLVLTELTGALSELDGSYQPEEMQDQVMDALLVQMVSVLRAVRKVRQSNDSEKTELLTMLAEYEARLLELKRVFFELGSADDETMIEGLRASESELDEIFRGLSALEYVLPIDPGSRRAAVSRQRRESARTPSQVGADWHSGA